MQTLFSVGECVDTIVRVFESDGTKKGHFGSLHVIEAQEFTAPGCDPVKVGHGYRVTLTEGPVFIVRRTGKGLWSVTFKAFEGLDYDLETATRLAWEIGRGRDVSHHSNLAAFIGGR
jgi:hypothetical protein